MAHGGNKKRVSFLLSFFSFTFILPCPLHNSQPSSHTFLPRSVPTTCPPTHNPLFPSEKRLTLETSLIYFPQGLPHQPDPLLFGNPEFPLTDECVFLPGAVCTTSAVERGLVLCEEPASNQLNNSGNWTLKDQVGQWRQLNLSHITNITAIETWGHSQHDRWRKQYLLYSSCDGEYWQPYEKVRAIFHVFSRHCYSQQSTYQK